MTIAPERLEQIQQLLHKTEYKNSELHPLKGDASFRRYIRVRKNGTAAMLMDAPPGKEDVRPFVVIAEYLVSQGFSAPVILARNVEHGLLLLEDLGDDSFTSVLKANPSNESQLYEAAVDVLAHWHDATKQFSKPDMLPLPRYDDALLLQEVSLFTDWYLPLALGKEKAQALRAEYLALWKKIFSEVQLSTQHWVHRDYHADNLMWLPQRKHVQRVGLLDFQDGVYGDAAYDLVSLLKDARRDVPPTLAEAMIERYITVGGVDNEHFRTAYAVLGAQRNSKIIGIFCRLAVRDHKSHYLNLLPRVWQHLERDVGHPALASLRHWLDKQVPQNQRGAITIPSAA